jgi:hypothetical protein
MMDPNDEFDFPKLSNALSDAYAHRSAIPASVDDAIRAAAAVRFVQRRRLRLMVRWGTGLAAGIAAAIVIIVSLHRTAPVARLARGVDRPLNMVDALTLAKHLAAKDSIDKSWDMNHDGVIDRNDVDAVAAASVSLKQNGLARHTLPTLQQLGVSARRVERSETSAPEDPSQILRKLRMKVVTSTVSLNKQDSEEVPQ